MSPKQLYKVIYPKIEILLTHDKFFLPLLSQVYRAIALLLGLETLSDGTISDFPLKETL